LNKELFINDIKQLVKREEPQLILDHYNKLVLWQNILFVIGISGIWIKYNFISIISLSIFTFTKWSISGHHICHGGYNICNVKNMNKKNFSIGFMRKIIDWLDWFLTEAWSYEHNHLHHSFLNENKDPDLIINIRNKTLLKDRYIYNTLSFIFTMITWKWIYYASNTFHNYKNKKNEINNTCFLNNAIFKYGFQFIKILLPYFIYRFLLIPLFFGYLLGSSYFYITLINLILTEIFTNIHSFITIASNHAGNDLYQFTTTAKTKNDIIYRSILGSTNYLCSNDFKNTFYDPDIIDFLQGYLNYQIEHHMFSDLSCLEYKLIAPKIEKICKKYDVPYIKENVFIRLYKLYRIFVFLDDMKIYIE